MTPKITRILLLMLALVFVFGCEDDKKDKKDKKKEAVVARKVPVEAVAATHQDIRDTIVSTSTVQARKSIDVVSEIPGRILSIEVEQGDSVKRNQLFARIHREELNLGMDAASSRVTRLKGEIERLRPLHEKGVISQSMFDEAVFRHQEALGEERRAQSAISDSRVKSPMDGVIALRTVNVGQQVATGTPLFQVVDPSELIVAVNLPETALGRVFEGQAAYVQSEALNDAQFAAVVERISPVVDPRSGTIRVILKIDMSASDAEKFGSPDQPTKPKMYLRPGMFVKSFIVTAEEKNALVIPRRGVIYQDEKATVFAIRDGIAKRVTVVLGVSEGSWVEVREGLKDSDVVVVLGHDGLKDGSPVDVELREVAAK